MSVVIVIAEEQRGTRCERGSGAQGNDHARMHNADREHADPHGDHRPTESGEIDRQWRQHALESRGRRQPDPDPDDARDQPDDRGRQKQRPRHWPSGGGEAAAVAAIP